MNDVQNVDAYPRDDVASGALELLDYRRQVFRLYQQVRDVEPGEDAWQRFRAGRDALFARHAQSALAQADRETFEGLPYYPYDPSLRFVTTLEPEVEPQAYEVALRDDGSFRFRRIGWLRFELQEEPVTLSLYQILGYGGGLFLPFGDATNGTETYGGGRYLLDTIKGADLGTVGDQLVLDFNYAYNPSCAYDTRWHCPLAPIENKLKLPIPAGERLWRSGAPSSTAREATR